MTASQVVWPRWRRKAACKRGHDLTDPAQVYHDRKGRRICKRCKWLRRYRAQQRPPRQAFAKANQQALAALGRDTAGKPVWERLAMAVTFWRVAVRTDDRWEPLRRAG